MICELGKDVPYDLAIGPTTNRATNSKRFIIVETWEWRELIHTMGVVSKVVNKALSKHYAVDRSLAVGLLIKRHAWINWIFSIVVDLPVTKAAQMTTSTKSVLIRKGRKLYNAI